jgi:uncharacterized protein YdeI (YjbR/CyaY-like superfamily)
MLPRTARARSVDVAVSRDDGDVDTFYAKNRREWRAWLSKNHKTANEIWLVYYRKETGKPRVSYNDAVEEALCYGWIDSIIRKVDDERFAQKFSPRRPKSVLSQMNRERVRKLIANKKMTKAGLAAIAHVYDPEDDEVDAFEVPKDILKELKSDKGTWRNFQSFPDEYKRIRVAWIDAARVRPEEFEKRLRYFLKMTKQGKRFGYVKEMR